MIGRPCSFPVLMALGLLACTDSSAARPVTADYGFINLTFHGQVLRLHWTGDSVVGFYDPVAQRLSLLGSTDPGPVKPNYLLLTLDSLPSTPPYPLNRHLPIQTLSVVFYETPGSDSSPVYPFDAQHQATDLLTIEALDFTRCEVRGRFQATLFYPGDPTPYPVTGAFWGRMVWNASPPGPC
jgi:hypothetical protein